MIAAKSDDVDSLLTKPPLVPLSRHLGGDKSLAASSVCRYPLY